MTFSSIYGGCQTSGRNVKQNNNKNESVLSIFRISLTLKQLVSLKHCCDFCYLEYCRFKRCVFDFSLIPVHTLLCFCVCFNKFAKFSKLRNMCTFFMAVYLKGSRGFSFFHSQFKPLETKVHYNIM